MTISINGSGTITGLSAGGLPDATIQPADLSTGGPYWDTSGNVGIGTSSPVGKLHVDGGVYAKGGGPSTGGYAFSGNSGDNDSGMYSSTDGTLNYYLNNAENIRYTTNSFKFGTGAVNLSRSSLVMCVGDKHGDWNNQCLQIEDTTATYGAPGIGFHAPTNSSAAVFKMWGAANQFECRNGSDSGFISILASSFPVSSDYRIKTDVVNVGSVLSNVLSLRPVNYEKDGINNREYGLIAHEAAEHFPELVQGEKDAMRDDGSMELQTVNYMGFTAVLIKAIQEQQAIITQLQADVAQLKGLT